MGKLTLYNISAEQQRINALLEETGGELTPEIEEALILNEQNFLTKADGYLESIAHYKMLAQAAAERIKQLQAYKRTAENIEERLRERLMYGMHTMGRNSAEIGLRKVSIRKTQSVNITDASRLPACYIVVETKPDKKRIGDAIRNGDLVPGAEIVTNETITIR